MTWKKKKKSTNFFILKEENRNVFRTHKKFLKQLEEVVYSTYLMIPNYSPTSWETYMQVRKQQLELDMEQQTGSK